MRNLLALFWLLAACGPGPVLYLGNASKDAGQDPGSFSDASTQGDSGPLQPDAGDQDGGDADSGQDTACVDAASCPTDRPLCDTARSRCVRCLSDLDCPSGLICTLEGECDDSSGGE